MTPAFLIRLMHYTPLVRVKLGPEDSEALIFANELRKATLEGRLHGLWLHPANELCGIPPKSPRSFLVRAAIARALGLINGASDYIFLFHNGTLVMEFKSKTGTMTQGQKDFRDWANMVSVPHYVVRSADAGLAILKDHGILT